MSFANIEDRGDVGVIKAAASLYFLLTGRFVLDFPDDVRRQLTMILQDKPVPIQHRLRSIPDGLAITIHRALATKPEDRFQDVAEFRQALQRFGS